MMCKTHSPDTGAGAGVCASCLRERLSAVLEISSGEHNSSAPSPTICKKSIPSSSPSPLYCPWPPSSRTPNPSNASSKSGKQIPQKGEINDFVLKTSIRPLTLILRRRKKNKKNPANISPSKDLSQIRSPEPQDAPANGKGLSRVSNDESEDHRRGIHTPSPLRINDLVLKPSVRPLTLILQQKKKKPANIATAKDLSQIRSRESQDPPVNGRGLSPASNDESEDHRRGIHTPPSPSRINDFVLKPPVRPLTLILRQRKKNKKKPANISLANDLSKIRSPEPQDPMVDGRGLSPASNDEWEDCRRGIHTPSPSRIKVAAAPPAGTQMQQGPRSASSFTGCLNPLVRPSPGNHWIQIPAPTMYIRRYRRGGAAAVDVFSGLVPNRSRKLVDLGRVW